jgi:hypothetical protein
VAFFCIPVMGIDFWRRFPRKGDYSIIDSLFEHSNLNIQMTSSVDIVSYPVFLRPAVLSFTTRDHQFVNMEAVAYQLNPVLDWWNDD